MHQIILSAERISKDFYDECKRICHARKIWTKDEIFNCAQKYKTKLEWFKNDNRAYQAAKRLSKTNDKSFFNVCTKHMK